MLDVVMAELKDGLLLVAGIAIVLFGTLLVVSGGNPMLSLRGISLASGLGAIGSFAFGGARMLGLGIMAAVVSALAGLVEYRLSERRARRLGKGSEPRDKKIR